MSSEIVEHIVLLKLKPDTDQSKIDAMVKGLNGLNSLDVVLHLTAGPLLRTRSSPFAFTHMLHSRYRSKEDLSSYSDHSSHVGVVAECVRPICEELMAVDWVAEGLIGPVVLQPGSAMRVTLLKLKEGLGVSETRGVLGAIGGIKDCFPSFDQISFGENFSPARAKGFSICSIVVLPGLSQLEALDSNSDPVKLQIDKVRDSIESFIVLDYLIPQDQSTTSL